MGQHRDGGPDTASAVEQEHDLSAPRADDCRHTETARAPRATPMDSKEEGAGRGSVARTEGGGVGILANQEQMVRKDHGKVKIKANR